MTPFDAWMKQLGQAADNKQAEPMDDLARRFDSLAECVRLILDGKQLEMRYLAELEGRIAQLESHAAPQPAAAPTPDERLRPVLDVLRTAVDSGSKFAILSPGAARLILEAIEGKR